MIEVTAGGVNATRNCLAERKIRMENVMRDLSNPRLIYAKGLLFLLLGILAAAAIIAQAPTFQTVLLVSITIWAFCRSYYFAFYVIEHYVDPAFKFAGLGAFLAYLARRPKK
jgi:hypothetical protein